MKKRDLKQGPEKAKPRLTRRNLLKVAGITALATTAGCAENSQVAEKKHRIPLVDYSSLGIRPFINCKGTYTAMSGSLMLPEVKAAMIEAAGNYVLMDDLMDAVGQRLAVLTGAEWGMITAGCNASQFGAACACAAGADPEKMALLPDTRGMKNEMVTPRNHRNTYDRAFIMVGLTMKTVNTVDEMDAAINENTALLPVLGDQSDRGDILLDDIIRLGKKHNVPVFVDAAAERPDAPNFYIEAGADLVAYSGGKCLRGPQSSGVMIGRKDLCKAAFLNLAPHHAPGRPMKCGKEEIMGCLAAVDLWINGRDHDAEWQEWLGMFEHISTAVTAFPSVTTEVKQPTQRSNYAPRLFINWERDKLNIEPREVAKQLDEGSPRIMMNSTRTGMFIMSYMMEDGDEIPVAERLAEILSKAV